MVQVIYIAVSCYKLYNYYSKLEMHYTAISIKVFSNCFECLWKTVVKDLVFTVVIYPKMTR